MPSRKELRYFDKHFHRSLRWRYAAQFRNGTGKVKGEITPSYGQLPLERMQFIRRLIPKVKLILILQNPIDRLWSTTRRAFTSAGKSLEDATEHQVLESFRNPRHRADIDYLSILDNWRRAFPEEQIFVGFFDEIETDPRNFLTKLFTFLEVSTKVDWSQFPYRQVINRNPPLPLPLVYRSHLEEIYQKDIETLFQRFGAPVASWRCAAPVQPQATRLAPI